MVETNNEIKTAPTDKKVSRQMDTQISIQHHLLLLAFKNIFLKPILFSYRPLIAKYINFLTFCVHFITNTRCAFDTL